MISAIGGLCPHCKTELETGFGLAGGGYGAYVYCPNDQCGKYFSKTQMHDEDTRVTSKERGE